MEMRMVLLPKSNFVNLSKFYKNAIEDPIFKMISILHPRSQLGIRVAYSENNSTLYEIVQKSTSYSSSWFVGNYLKNGGGSNDLYLFTKLNPLYLFIAALENQDRQSLCCIKDVWQVYSSELAKVVVKVDYTLIGEVEEESIRWNVDKTLNWLVCKVKAVQRVLDSQRKELNVVKTFALPGEKENVLSKNIDSEASLKKALQCVGEYLSENMYLKLCDKMRMQVDLMEEPIKNVVHKDAPVGEALPNHFDHRKSNVDGKKRKVQSNPKKVVPKVAKAQRISSFFTKKTK